MKKIYKNIGLLGLLLFSFYYTEKIAIIMQNKSPLMQEIISVTKAHEEESVNALISGDYISPGISGKSINKTKSYVNMKSFGVFNEHYLIFDNIKPDISIEDNKDKIINKGNKVKKSVSLLIENNKDILNYLKKQNIKASVLINQDNYKDTIDFEQINNDSKSYTNIESLLNKNNKNTNICYIKNIDKRKCIKEKKYLIEESFYLNANNIIDAKKNIDNGSIILIKKDVNIEYLQILLNEIKFKGLNIIYVSELIDEKK